MNAVLMLLDKFEICCLLCLIFVQSILASGLVLLEAILCGALLLYFPVSLRHVLMYQFLDIFADNLFLQSENINLPLD